MEFTLEGRCVVTLSHQKGTETSQHVSTDFNLSLSPNLDRSQYLDAEGLPTKEGTKALTNVFVQGLVGNVHQAHQNGFMDSAEHLRYIIAELEKGFAAVANVHIGELKNP